MQKDYKNKQMTGDGPAKTKETYFFPEYQQSVEAESIEEAEKIIKETIINNE